MAKRAYTARVTYSATQTANVQYMVDEDADSEAVSESAHSAARESLSRPPRGRVEVHDLEYTGERPRSVDRHLVPVEADWIAWRGHRWATDGWCLLREDVPPQDYTPTPWLRGLDAAYIECAMGPPVDGTTPGPHPGIFDGRYAPIRGYGDKERIGAGTSKPTLRPLVVLRAGEVVAVIMPQAEATP